MLNYKKLYEINQKFVHFRNGIRVLMLIDRGVMNANKGSRRWINKIITTDPKSWLNALERLIELQNNIGNPDVRLYGCMNDRKLDRSINMFRHRELDLQPDDKIKFYSKINNTFCSCLMKPENKLSKYMLLDIDVNDTNEVDKFVSDNLIQIILTYPSKNGWHYIVNPFNIMLANGYKTFKVLKDGLLLLNWIDE